MRFYYLMHDSENEPKSLIVANDYNFRHLEYSFNKGNRIQWSREYAMFYETGTIADDYLPHVCPSATVVSQKIKNILDELKINGLEFFPVPIKHRFSNFIFNNYYVLNVLNVAKDALDRERSKIFINRARDINTETIIAYCLKKEKIRNLDMFHISDGSIFISVKIKKAFDAGRVTGLAYGNVSLS